MIWALLFPLVSASRVISAAREAFPATSSIALCISLIAVATMEMESAAIKGGIETLGDIGDASSRQTLRAVLEALPGLFGIFIEIRQSSGGVLIVEGLVQQSHLTPQASTLMSYPKRSRGGQIYHI